MACSHCLSHPSPQLHGHSLHDVFCLLMLYFTACRFLYALLAVTIGAFAGAIALIAVSFYWFNPSGAGDCSFNIFVLAVTILLTLAVSLGSLHPQVGRISVCVGYCSSCDLLGKVSHPQCWLCMVLTPLLAFWCCKNGSDSFRTVWKLL